MLTLSDCKYVFTLITKKMDEEEKLYAFTIVDEVVKKDEFLTNLTKAICANMCRADYVSWIGCYLRQTFLS